MLAALLDDEDGGDDDGDSGDDGFSGNDGNCGDDGNSVVMVIVIPLTRKFHQVGQVTDHRPSP